MYKKVGLGFDYDQYEILTLNDYGVQIAAGNGRDATSGCNKKVLAAVSGSVFKTSNNEPTAATKVEWVSRDVVDLSELPPAGMENSFPEYVGRCRHIHPDTFIPGKFLEYLEVEYCYFGYNGTEFGVTDIAKYHVHRYNCLYIPFNKC